MRSNTEHIVMPEDHMDELYHAKNPIVRFVHVQRLEKIAELVQSPQSLSILDAGCGEGHLIQKMHEKNGQHQYYGLDATPIAAEKARERCAYATILLGNLTQLPFPDNYFDIVTCTEVLEHVPAYEKALSEFERVLKPNGKLILTFPNETLWTISRFILRRNPVKVPDHVNSFFPSYIKTKSRLACIKSTTLPFGLPFTFSLNGLMVFQKN